MQVHWHVPMMSHCNGHVHVPTMRDYNVHVHVPTMRHCDDRYNEDGIININDLSTTQIIEYLSHEASL